MEPASTLDVAAILRRRKSMTETDRLVALSYAASTHTLDEFLRRYDECAAALTERQVRSTSAPDTDAITAIADKLGGPA
jgi:hypothetical protein